MLLGDMVISKILSGLGHFIHPNPVLVSRPASVPPFPTHKRYLLIANYYEMVGFPSGSVLKNPPAMQETRVQSLGWEDPLEKEMATHFSVCLGNLMDTGAWWTTVHGAAKELNTILWLSNNSNKNYYVRSSTCYVSLILAMIPRYRCY